MERSAASARDGYAGESWEKATILLIIDGSIIQLNDDNLWVICIKKTIPVRWNSYPFTWFIAEVVFSIHANIFTMLMTVLQKHEHYIIRLTFLKKWSLAGCGCDTSRRAVFADTWGDEKMLNSASVLANSCKWGSATSWSSQIVSTYQFLFVLFFF